MRKLYKYRIYPNNEQEAVLKRTIGSCRFIYNWALEKKNKEWAENKSAISKFQISKELTELKKEDSKTWLTEVSSVCLQQSLSNLDAAFVRFFKKNSNYPKFKRKKDFGCARFMSNAFSLTNSKSGSGLILKVAKVNAPIKVIWSRDLPSKPSSCTISRNPSGQWHASFLCESQKKKVARVIGEVGIDLGVKNFATLNDGRKFRSNFKKRRLKIEFLQKKLSKKRLGSKNREKIRLKLAKAHQKTADARKDFLHKLTTNLVRENQTIAIEDLFVAGLHQTKNSNRGLSRSIGEQGWGTFRKMLSYKCEEYGRDLLVVNRFFPSSKMCSSCGMQKGIRLSERQWKCPCGAKHDRDINAAKNILAAGLAAIARGGSETGDVIKTRSRRVQRSGKFDL